MLTHTAHVGALASYEAEGGGSFFALVFAAWPGGLPGAWCGRGGVMMINADVKFRRWMMWRMCWGLEGPLLGI